MTMNLKMRITTVIALLAIFTLAHAQDTLPTMHLTLDKAIELALSENPTIKVAEKEIELKKVSQNEAWMNMLPTASLNGSINYTIKAPEMNFGGQSITMGKDDASTWNGTLQVSLPIAAPAIWMTIGLTKADVELAAEKSRGSKIDMVNQVTKAYYQLLLAQDSYDVLMQNYKLAEDNFNIVNAKFTQGRVSEYDKISAEVQKSNAWPSVISGRNAVEIAKLQLKVLMGITADVNIIIDDNLKNYETAMDKDAAKQAITLDNNSSLKAIDLQAKLLKKQRNILKTSFMPTLALSGSLQYQSLYNEDWKVFDYKWGNSSSIALSLTIPLFQASNFTKMKSNKIQQWQLSETRANTERMLGMQAQSYLDNMTKSAEQLESNKTAVELAKKGLEISQKRYDVGKGTILELTNSQVSLTNVQLAYNNTIYDYLVAKSELNTILGKE
ncbi:MAG: TolC family protein [Bacteroidaceae bacterium]|nr:TolC family protein [Bacteroidaceae bacterium]